MQLLVATPFVASHGTNHGLLWQRPPDGVAAVWHDVARAAGLAGRLADNVKQRLGGQGAAGSMKGLGAGRACQSN
jgi:hypothetical protein